MNIGSHLFSVSTRSWIGMAFAATTCYLAAKGKLDPKDFMATATFVLGHLFATNLRPKTQ